MDLQISNPILVAIYNYFTDFDERYSRKQFAAILLLSTIVFFVVYGLGTDHTKLMEVQQDISRTAYDMTVTDQISMDAAHQKLLENKDFLGEFNKSVTEIFPSSLWMCLIMLITLPAIIKRTNDTAWNKPHAYPVVIYYVLFTLFTLFNISFDPLNIVTALSFYSFFFVSIIAVMPSQEEELK